MTPMVLLVCVRRCEVGVRRKPACVHGRGDGAVPVAQPHSCSSIFADSWRDVRHAIHDALSASGELSRQE